MTQCSSFVAASEPRDICHGRVRVELDHRRFTCSQEIAFHPAENYRRLIRYILHIVLAVVVG